VFALASSACSAGGTGSNPPADHADATAIASAATDYFVNGIGNGDWAVAARRSTGSLKIAAEWLVGQGISASEEQRGTFAIHSMAVSSIDGSAASLSFDATQTGSNYVSTYAGPVSMVKTPEGWKVADYLRGGRDAASAIFPDAHGRASRSGVSVSVVGAQLEAGHVDAWVRLSNQTRSTLSWDRPIVIVDGSGRQRGRGSLFVSSADTSEPFEMLPHVSAFGDFLVESVTLPLTTRRFRLLVGATGGSSRTPIDLSILVTLR
jgi:hypothetical protein